MTANEPWSGHYEPVGPIWVTAHTTQFTKPGWHYLKTVGHLNGGGSYVSLTDGHNNVTIVIETLSHDQSVCIRPFLPSYVVKEQNATFAIRGWFDIKELHMWQSQLGADSTDDQLFVYKGIIPVNPNGEITVFLPVDVLITLSTIKTAQKGTYPTPPPSHPFPLPYTDNFKANGFTEAFNFADQSGKFEIYHNASATDEHQWTLQQVVTIRPVTLCDDPNLGITMIGDYKWSNVAVSVQIKLQDAKGAFVALRVDKGGCDARVARGVFLWIMSDRSWMLTADLAQDTTLISCSAGSPCWKSELQEWNDVTLSVSKNTNVKALLNGVEILEYTIAKEDYVPENGFVAIGTANFAKSQFDLFSVKEA
uniref:Galactocerebrosidase n=1 Tax=Phallusia mammillata TaxID=59560 RepID=A0A6F9DE58_9ASCI|nr:galactocerebrosidase [Phallusia mammillata]